MRGPDYMDHGVMNSPAITSKMRRHIEQWFADNDLTMNDAQSLQRVGDGAELRLYLRDELGDIYSLRAGSRGGIATKALYVDSHPFTNEK